MNKINFKIKNLLLTLVLTLALLLSGTATVFATNHKSTNAFADEYDTLYYFSDIINTTGDATDFQQQYENFTIRTFNPNTLLTLLNSSDPIPNIMSSIDYYTKIDYGTVSTDVWHSVVVFEFMVRRPDTQVLESVISTLQANENQVILVSGFSKDSYNFYEDYLEDNNIDFLYVDIVGDFINTNVTSSNIDASYWTDTVFVLDRRFIAWELSSTVETQEQEITLSSYNDITESRFIKTLLVNLGNALNLSEEDLTLQTLYDNYGILFLLHNTGGNFISLHDGNDDLLYTDGVELYNTYNEEGKNFQAITYGPIESNLYDLFEYMQSQNIIIPIDVLQIGPMSFGPGGLIIQQFNQAASLYIQQKQAELFLLIQQ